MVHSVCVPVISMGLPPPVLLVPNPPRITLGRDLAKHTNNTFIINLKRMLKVEQLKPSTGT
jgi:hypothetical protein